VLPYDAEALISAVASYHRDHPLASALAAAIAVIALLLAIRGTAPSRRAVPLLLAACWAWIGAVWHFGIFAQLNFAAPAYGILFFLQGVILAWLGLGGRLEFGPPTGWPGAVGIALALIALVILPLADLLQGWPWSAARLAGADPCPTAVLTLGVLLLARPPRLSVLAIPALWTLVAAATGWVLAIHSDQTLPLAVLMAFAAARAARRRAAIYS